MPITGYSNTITVTTTYDTDAQAFFDRVATAGGTLSTTEKLATNQLVLDMKSAGIWTSMKAVYPMVGASAAACSQNLVSSSFTGSFSSGWTFASTGITGNGLTNYMQTNLNMSTQLPTGANIGFYGRTNFTGLSTYPAAWDASASPIFNYLAGIQYQDSYLGTTATLLGNQSGYLGFFQRSATTGVQNRRLGNVSKGTNSNNYTAANANLTLCYAGANSQTNSEIAFFSAGDYITTTQQDTFYTIVQTFQTTLSRQV